MKPQDLLKRTLQLSFIFCVIPLLSQNLLDTSTWIIGSGSAGEFIQNGDTEENSREYHNNHLDNEVIVWKATPDNDGGRSGGWNTDYHSADHTKTYRFSVWIKKINSNDGGTFFGCFSVNSSTHRTLKLDGTINTNPYFWYGDLPQLDKWYLLVGYIHDSGYTSNISIGGIYDGVTQEQVANTTDLKFSELATNVRHRAYLFWTNNPNAVQYFYAPRIDEINGNEPSLSQLFLQANENSILKFAYDTAGNQIERQYCEDATCPTRVSETIKSKDAIAEISAEEDILELDELLKLYPNPTKGKITIQSKGDAIKAIHVFDIKGALLNTFNYNTPEVDLDLTQYPVGMYYAHLHFESGESITKKIIKQ